MVALLAISAAFFWALSDVITRIGLRYCNALSALLITLLSSLFITFVISLLVVPLELFLKPAIFYFLVAGVVGPCIGRLLLFVGIYRVGASVSATLAGIRPLFAAIAAVAILGESITYSILGGTLLITLGVTTVTWRDSGYTHMNRSRKDLLLPLLAGVFYGLANVIRKMGLNMIPEPLLGLTVQNATALAFFPLLTVNLASRPKLILNEKKIWVILGLNGFAIVIAHLCLFLALQLGEVVVVSPLSSINPFFVLLLAKLFLRNLEKVTPKIILGAVFIVAGSAVLTAL